MELSKYCRSHPAAAWHTAHRGTPIMSSSAPPENGDTPKASGRLIPHDKPWNLGGFPKYCDKPKKNPTNPMHGANLWGYLSTIICPALIPFVGHRLGRNFPLKEHHSRLRRAPPIQTPKPKITSEKLTTIQHRFRKRPYYIFLPYHLYIQFCSILGH